MGMSARVLKNLNPKNGKDQPSAQIEPHKNSCYTIIPKMEGIICSTYSIKVNSP